MLRIRWVTFCSGLPLAIFRSLAFRRVRQGLSNLSELPYLEAEVVRSWMNNVSALSNSMNEAHVNYTAHEFNYYIFLPLPPLTHTHTYSQNKAVAQSWTRDLQHLITRRPGLLATILVSCISLLLRCSLAIICLLVVCVWWALNWGYLLLSFLMAVRRQVDNFAKTINLLGSKLITYINTLFMQDCMSYYFIVLVH